METVYVRPRMDRYGAIKPIQSKLATERDTFAELAAEAPDMRRVAWTVCLHNTPLGMRHPEFTVRNCYGDSYVYNLCPAYEEVRRYVVTLCTDMAERYELDGLALETPGFLPFDHGFHHEFFPAANEPLGRLAFSGSAFPKAPSPRRKRAASTRSGFAGRPARRSMRSLPGRSRCPTTSLPSGGSRT